MSGACSTNWEKRNAYKFSAGLPEGTVTHERPMRRRENNIKMDLEEIGWGMWTAFIWLRIGTSGGLL
jgi:hypothetical protein